MEKMSKDRGVDAETASLELKLGEAAGRDVRPVMPRVWGQSTLWTAVGGTDSRALWLDVRVVLAEEVGQLRTDRVVVASMLRGT